MHRMVFLMVLWRCPVFSLLSFWQEQYSNKGEFGVLAAWHLHEKTEALGENPVPAPLCSHRSHMDWPFIKNGPPRLQSICIFILNSHHPMHRPGKCPAGMDRPTVFPVLAPTTPWGCIMDICPHDILLTITPSNIWWLCGLLAEGKVENVPKVTQTGQSGWLSVSTVMPVTSTGEYPSSST